MQIHTIHMQIADITEMSTPALGGDSEKRFLLRRNSGHFLSLIKRKNNDGGNKSQGEEDNRTDEKGMHLIYAKITG